MKQKILLPAAILCAAAAACQNAGKPATASKALSEKAIAIHDAIMPQISVFDKQTLIIDSLLANLADIKASRPDLDTTDTRRELSGLKTDLESATDGMMAWMREYERDNADTIYQNAEIQRVTDLKTTFESVSAEAERLLDPFKTDR